MMPHSVYYAVKRYSQWRPIWVSKSVPGRYTRRVAWWRCVEVIYWPVCCLSCFVSFRFGLLDRRTFHCLLVMNLSPISPLSTKHGTTPKMTLETSILESTQRKHRQQTKKKTTNNNAPHIGKLTERKSIACTKTGCWSFKIVSTSL